MYLLTFAHESYLKSEVLHNIIAMVSLQNRIDSLSQSLIENEEENVETEPEANGNSLIADTSLVSNDSTASAYRRRAASIEWPPRKQPRTVETVEVGCLNVISGKYESLDYDIPDSDLLLDEERSNGMKYETKKSISRWIVFMLIGVITAGIGVFLDVAIDQLSELKYGSLKKYVDDSVAENCLYFPYLMWVLFNVGFVLIGSLLVTYSEPVAAGSGIPQVKCYLNGVKVPRVVRIKTLLVKVVGVVCSVSGGLAVGKEGPMIHSGAVVAAGISQGKSTTLGKDFNIFNFFREDHEKRDFVSGGAAAGVAAAFGAPVGGVLFSLEEGTSFWNQSLTWRVFLCAMVSTVTLNGILSMYKHLQGGKMWSAGLLGFGKFPEIPYYWFELIIYMLMGLVGGLFGSLFNYINYQLTVFRMRYINNKLWMKVIEAALVAAVTATVGFGMIFYLNDCRPLGQDPTKFPIQVFCGDGEYNALGALWFQTPESSVKALLSDPPGSHKVTSLSIFFILYYLLSIWTYGLSISAGLFIPALLTGAAWGRLTGMGLMWLFPDQEWVDLRKYALIGAAAQLGGVVRMTISLTVILIEATGNIMFGLPLMLTLICAKWMGDFFNEGIYDMHIMLSGVPLLPWEPPPLSHNIYASEIMSHPVVVLRTVERVARIVQILTSETHNGFPVVDPGHDQTESLSFGKLRGLILRHQLIVLLQNKIFNERSDLWDPNNYKVALKLFRDEYPRYKQIQDISLSSQEMRCTIDLRPFMSSSPYVVIHSMTLPRVFRIFRALGLRHLPVVDDMNQVVGMVTRKDLARYRVHYHKGKTTREELKISEKI